MTSSVYFFGDGRAEGTKDMETILGGKGDQPRRDDEPRRARPPPDFTIACHACIDFLRDGVVPDTLRRDVEANLRRLEDVSGKRFGDPTAPLLVSVRSGAPVSMPGMMETILNLGLRGSHRPRPRRGERQRALRLGGLPACQGHGLLLTVRAGLSTH